MTAYHPRLFLGFCVDPSFQHIYSHVPAEKKALFVQNGDQYLQEHFNEERLYLGRFIDGASDVSSLELLSLNIFSLLKKIVPDYPYQKNQLWLIPVIHENHL